jgi:hypothetical protein
MIHVCSDPHRTSVESPIFESIRWRIEVISALIDAANGRSCSQKDLIIAEEQVNEPETQHEKK